MNIPSHIWHSMTATGIALAAFGILGSPVMGDETDPTTPSSQILEHLAPPPVTSQAPAIRPAPQEIPLTLPQLRLKAMVLRDASHGAALVATSSSQVYRVPLRAVSKGNPPVVLSIGGVAFVVESFSKNRVVFRVHNSQTLLVAN